jgi:aryl-alcohol dehydrogenase-like predicted oxidoreductase
VRGPLGTGLLGGGHTAGSQITDVDDFRFRSPDWLNYFDNGRPVERYMKRLEAIRDVLTGNGRTLAQGALCWLLARSSRLIPIPGARTVEQVRDNARALEHGPLSPAEVAEIRELLTLAELAE